MAEQILTDAFIKLDAVEYSGNAVNVALSTSAEAQDITAMGDTTRRNIGGLKDWSLALEFNADEAATGALFNMVGTVVPVEVRAKSAVISATNPAYRGDALVTEYNPLSGNVGDVHRVALSLVSAGPLTRVTTGL